MATNNDMRIETAVIRATEAQIRQQNQRLTEILEESQKAVQSLRGEWEGVAADTTIGSYDAFAAKYFAEYQQMLTDYADFLKIAAGEGYETVEQKVDTLGKELEV